MGNGSSLNGSLSGDVLTNASVVFANPTALSYGGSITGSGGVTLDGAGTVALGGNGYSGGTTIRRRMLLDNAGRLGSGGVTLRGSWHLLPTRRHPQPQPYRRLAFGQRPDVNPHRLRLDRCRKRGRLATLAGSVGLDKTTSGTFLLSGTNLYSGGTSVSAGVVQLGSARALPAAAA